MDRGVEEEHFGQREEREQRHAGGRDGTVFWKSK